MSVFLSSMKAMGTQLLSGLLGGGGSGGGGSNKAFFLTEQGERLPVQFNPEQLKITKSVEYKTTTTKENEKEYAEFSGVVSPTMEISFFFDTSGSIPEDSGSSGLSLSTITSLIGLGDLTGGPKEKDVQTLSASFSNLIKIVPSLHRPSWVLFVWGSVNFLGFVKQVSTSYTMFTKDGMPIRAQVDAVIMGFGESGSSKIALESPDRTKSRVVSDDTSIWSLAGNEYDDISKWRLIAKANGIMDPFDIQSGTVLKVPAFKE